MLLLMLLPQRRSGGAPNSADGERDQQESARFARCKLLSFLGQLLQPGDDSASRRSMYKC